METDITLSIHVTEDERETRAKAVLDMRGDHFEAIGQARRNPSDPQKPLIGEELAVARALRKLESALMEAAWDKIEQRAVLA